MRVVFVADGRSPIARGWIDDVLDLGHEVHLVSTFLCRPWPRLSSLTVIPVAFSGLRRGGSGRSGMGGVRGRARLRQWLGPLTVPLAGRHLRRLLAVRQPDLVHALRIPFEGMMAAWADPQAPLAVSTWGNDFSLHAASSPLMAWLTRRTVRAADGLHADCQRDLDRASHEGFAGARPSVVLPGNGGVAAPFLADDPIASLPERSSVRDLIIRLTREQPLVCNPRGLRAYVRSDTFFKCIPRVLAARPDVHFAAVGMADQPMAQGWSARLGIGGSLTLLGGLTPAEMAALLTRSQVMVSPSEHDGTPNSLLESMACGAMPVAGDLASLREWIKPGENGLLIDPSDPQALADAVLAALGDPGLRARAAARNRRLVEARATRGGVRQEIDRFYARLVASRQGARA